MNTRFVLLLLSCALVVADHFDYGAVCWNLKSGTPTTARTYTFTVFEGFQRQWPGWPSPPNEGTTLSSQQTAFGIVPMKAGSTNTAAVASIQLDLTTTVVQPNGPAAEQWIIGTKTFDLTTSGDADKNWRFQYEALARKVNILEGNGKNTNNNNDVYYRFQGALNRFATRSICAVSSIPYIYVDYNVPNVLIVPVLNDDEVPLRFGYPKTTESKLNTVFPQNPAQPAGGNGIVTQTDKTKLEFRLNSITGVYTWQPNIKGDYAVQFLIEELCAPSQGTVCQDAFEQTDCCSRTMLDILLRVVDPDPTAPAFTNPFDAATTDPENRKLYANEGEPYTQQICVDKPSATIFSSGLPAGATLTLTSPQTDPTKTCYTFSWPNPTKDAYICFGASISPGGTYKVNHGQYCIKFVVRRKVTLLVYNLPKADKQTPASDTDTSPPHKNWFAFPSTPNKTDHKDILQVRVITSIPHTGNFFLQGQKEPYKSNNTYKPEGYPAGSPAGTAGGTPVKVTKVQTIKDGLLDMLVWEFPWGEPRLANWKFKINVAQDEHHQAAQLIFVHNYHWFPTDGRWLAPDGLVTGSNYVFYANNWESVNGYTSLNTVAMAGWTAGHGADLQCGYNQVINPKPGPHDWYKFTGVPVLEPASGAGNPNGGNLPFLNVNKFAILTLVDGTDVMPTPDQMDKDSGPAPLARVFAQYCIDTDYFDTFK